MKNIIDTQNSVRECEMVKVTVVYKSSDGESVAVSAMVPSANSDNIVEKQLATCMEYFALGVITDYRVYKEVA